MPSIDVVVATYNARSTIERAIRSALACRHVRQVIVTDDASTDGTPDLVAALFAGDPQVVVLRGEANAGPARARNRAIAVAEADHLAILDSDDFFLPQRFDAIFEGAGFDIWADNILFTNDVHAAPATTQAAGGAATRSPVDLIGFIDGNLNNFWQRRRQLGFVKPVFRRGFLLDTAIRYDESLRLGEDFILLMDMLAAGARFDVTRQCGYVAIERVDSLSARHDLQDLANLLTAETRIRSTLTAGPRRAAAAFDRRFYQTKCKFNFMNALARRRRDGVRAGLDAVTSLPLREAVDVFSAISADKLRTALRASQAKDRKFSYYLM